MQSFFKKLSAAVDKKCSKLCIGIDPNFTDEQLENLLLPAFKVNKVADALTRWSQTIIEAAKEVSCSVKFQSACFEAYGDSGIRALQVSMKLAKGEGLRVILDAKRSDIGSTMSAYGRASFDFYEADAMTINLYHGTDTLDGLLPWLKSGKAVYVVWLTSNPSYSQFQTFTNSADITLSQHMLEVIDDYQERHKICSIGLVLGATNTKSVHPKNYSKLGKYPLLMPGVGHQNADTNDAAFRKISTLSAASVIPVSRGLLSNINLVDSPLCLDKISATVHKNAHNLVKLDIFKSV